MGATRQCQHPTLYCVRVRSVDVQSSKFQPTNEMLTSLEENVHMHT